ncbi:ATP-binding cassette domain-containing protein [Corynebacterium sp. A21]|uniref:ATP-binding cassette domain-containing protein n=1 Tax=Corynebacterium sp. A21 TaxID=3457318 RepID=UPI003FD5EC2E
MRDEHESDSPVVAARGLHKNYKNKKVLNGLDFELAEGQLHGLLGRNGTGKSTLLSILTGQIPHSAGEARVFGQPPFDNAAVMDRVVYAGIDVPFPAGWRPDTIFAAAAGRYPGWHQPTADELIVECELDVRTKYAKLSRGQRSMVGIIVGLAARAPLTLLDEPYLGLDVHNRGVFYAALLREMDQQPRTVMLATHHIEESTKLLDTFLILGRDGRVHHHLGAEELDDAYVTVSGAHLPDIGVTLARTEVAGRARALVPRAGLTGVDKRSLAVEPADLDEVITALLEGA